MEKLKKLRKRLLAPVWGIYKLLPFPKYRPAKYWKERHAKYGLDLRGVGNCSLSLEINEKAYLEAGKVFLDLCNQVGIDFKTVRILDVGCGNGFYSRIFREQGGMDYLGIDITDELLPTLRKEFPGFYFQKLDIAKKKLRTTFDLIIMIDVTQHIVSDKRFSFAMQNIRSHLTNGGTFIVTSWLSEKRVQRKPHEVARPMNYYTKEFDGCRFTDPTSFRDKYIFAVTKK